MAEWSKSQKRRLREIADQAWEREMTDLLEELEDAFRAWRSGEIETYELNERIHQYHDRDARQVWKVYNSMKAPELVARAVGLGLVEPDQVPDEVLARLGRLIEFWSADDTEEPPTAEPDGAPGDAENGAAPA